MRPLRPAWQQPRQSAQHRSAMNSNSVLLRRKALRVALGVRRDSDYKEEYNVTLNEKTSYFNLQRDSGTKPEGATGKTD